MAKGLKREKACQMLHEGRANKHDITDRQRRYFGAVCGGRSKKRRGRRTERR